MVPMSAIRMEINCASTCLGENRVMVGGSLPWLHRLCQMAWVVAVAMTLPTPAYSADWQGWNVSPGDRLVYVERGGRIADMTLTTVRDGVAEAVYADNCTIRMHVDGFSPRIEWRGCADGTGQTTLARQGRIFPLMIGASESWTDTGDAAKSQSCEVVGREFAKTPIGDFDAYLVRCESQYVTREFHFAVELGVPVTSIRRGKGPLSAIGFDYRLCALTLRQSRVGLGAQDGVAQDGVSCKPEDVAAN